MHGADTIAAISTPPGGGAIGVIRLSGPAARSLLNQVWQGTPSPFQFEDRRVYLGNFKDFRNGELLDQVLTFWMKGPHSYTGEDVVEIQAHGGYRLLEILLAVLVAAGARLAKPGEFSRRAFLNGRLDLTQAEAVCDLISASTREAARLAEQQLTGLLSHRVKKLRNHLLVMKAQLEAMIDFPEDEDVQGLRYGEVAERVDTVMEEIRRLLVTYREGRIYREGIRIAIIGKPNVGKSSLLNALLGEERAIVHPTPGTTRDLIEETIEVQGILLKFVDTAGLRKGTEPIEEEGIRRTRERIATADLILAVFDASRPWEREDDEVLEAASGRETFCIVNKIDLAPDLTPLPPLPELTPPSPSLPISAKTGEGIDTLKERIFHHFVHGGVAADLVLTNLRHKVALEKGLEVLSYVKEGALKKVSLEFLASDLWIASGHLAEITGEITTDEILGEIFSKFCLGK